MDDAADDHLADFIPTPEQIRAGCAEIQSRWSRDEERRRRLWSERLSTIPTVSAFEAPESDDH